MTSAKSQPETPELDKMHKVKEDSQKIGEFLEWLGSQGIELMQWRKNYPRDRHPFPIGESIEKLLYRYFEIDFDKAEAERRALLDYVREQA